jgi:hypothetical protein
MRTSLRSCRIEWRLRAADGRIPGESAELSINRDSCFENEATEPCKRSGRYER